MTFPITTNASCPLLVVLFCWSSLVADAFVVGSNQQHSLAFVPTTLKTTDRRRGSIIGCSSNRPQPIRSNIVLPWLSLSSSVDGSSQKSGISNSNNKQSKYDCINVGANIGTGSYGTVHLCTFLNDAKDTTMIAKRAWTEADLVAAAASNNQTSNTSNDKNNYKERAKRCLYYLQVERECYQKMQQQHHLSSGTSYVPTYIGTFLDAVDNHEWIVLSFIGRHTTTNDRNNTNTNRHPAVNLADAIYTDWMQQHKATTNSHRHHLAVLQRELDLEPKDKQQQQDMSFEHTLDTFFISLFSAIARVHQMNIVHCDIKPANILLDPSTSSVVIIDFGSAVILNSNNNNKNGGLSGVMKLLQEETQTIVALSPMYAAPEETKVKSPDNKAPCAFDVYSCGLIFCQLLFNLLDDRTEAAFHQQLRETRHDLDLWLSTKVLSSKMRPSGLEDGLTYLSNRPGLWNILRGILKVDPSDRYTAQEALLKFHTIVDTTTQDSSEDDGAFFQSVISNLEQCELNLEDELEETKITTTTIPRPLHFIATFDRSNSLGLILSEVDDENDDDDDDKKWKNAIAARRGTPGEVFIRGLVKGGQADTMGGIFEIGDRLVGVGEIPIFDIGFDKVVNMLSNQPKSAKTITLHFDRISKSKAKATQQVINISSRLVTKTIDHGAWTAVGRRKAQEDSFVLQELHDGNGNDILIAAVFDGHGGRAASQTASQIFPGIVSSQIISRTKFTASSSGSEKKFSQALGDIIESSWEMTCNTYRNGCEELGSCVADYDPREGVVLASTASSDLVAGTTAVAATVSIHNNNKNNNNNDDDDDDDDDDYMLHLLHCGDSRAVLAGRPRGDETESSTNSFVHYSTRDHSPRCEMEAARLRKGIEAGLDYSLPQCSMSRWWLTIGDYQYAVSRSLEGTFATSKGIVSTPDVDRINLRRVLAERKYVSLALASDGLFEVIDNEELSRELVLMREAGCSAKDAAKTIVSRAIKKGTSDNVSVVVMYFS